VSGAGTKARSGAQRQAIFLLALHCNLIRAPDNGKNSTSGAVGAPDLDTFKFNLQNFSAKTTFAWSPVVRPIQGLREKLRKVATPRRENRKVRHEIEILEANKHAP
jgi:hypothetical protein